MRSIRPSQRLNSLNRILLRLASPRRLELYFNFTTVACGITFNIAVINGYRPFVCGYNFILGFLRFTCAFSEDRVPEVGVYLNYNLQDSLRNVIMT